MYSLWPRTRAPAYSCCEHRYHRLHLLPLLAPCGCSQVSEWCRCGQWTCRHHGRRQKKRRQRPCPCPQSGSGLHRPRLRLRPPRPWAHHPRCHGRARGRLRGRCRRQRRPRNGLTTVPATAELQHAEGAPNPWTAPRGRRHCCCGRRHGHQGAASSRAAAARQRQAGPGPAAAHLSLPPAPCDAQLRGRVSQHRSQRPTPRCRSRRRCAVRAPHLRWRGLLPWPLRAPGPPQLRTALPGAPACGIGRAQPAGTAV